MVFFTRIKEAGMARHPWSAEVAEARTLSIECEVPLHRTRTHPGDRGLEGIGKNRTALVDTCYAEKYDLVLSTWHVNGGRTVLPARPAAGGSASPIQLRPGARSRGYRKCEAPGSSLVLKRGMPPSTVKPITRRWSGQVISTPPTAVFLKSSIQNGYEAGGAWVEAVPTPRVWLADRVALLLLVAPHQSRAHRKNLALPTPPAETTATSPRQG
jgi:hypothetical protein